MDAKMKINRVDAQKQHYCVWTCNKKGGVTKGLFFLFSFWFQRAGLVALYVFLKEKWNGNIIVTTLSFYINTRSC